MQALSTAVPGKMVHESNGVRSTGGAGKIKEFKIKEGSEIHVIQNDASVMMIIGI